MLYIMVQHLSVRLRLVDSSHPAYTVLVHDHVRAYHPQWGVESPDIKTHETWKGGFLAVWASSLRADDGPSS